MFSKAVSVLGIIWQVEPKTLEVDRLSEVSHPHSSWIPLGTSVSMCFSVFNEDASHADHMWFL